MLVVGPSVCLSCSSVGSSIMSLLFQSSGGGVVVLRLKESEGLLRALLSFLCTIPLIITMRIEIDAGSCSCQADDGWEVQWEWLLICAGRPGCRAPAL